MPKRPSRARSPVISRLVLALRELLTPKDLLQQAHACPAARNIERLISVVGCLLEYVEAREHTRELVHPDCQACLDVRSATDLLDELAAATPRS